MSQNRLRNSLKDLSDGVYMKMSSLKDSTFAILDTDNPDIKDEEDA
jgi:hypothetical protein